MFAGAFSKWLSDAGDGGCDIQVPNEGADYAYTQSGCRLQRHANPLVGLVSNHSLPGVNWIVNEAEMGHTFPAGVQRHDIDHSFCVHESAACPCILAIPPI
jgi:hypothetical protein